PGVRHRPGGARLDQLATPGDARPGPDLAAGDGRGKRQGHAPEQGAEPDRAEVFLDGGAARADGGYPAKLAGGHGAVMTDVGPEPKRRGRPPLHGHVEVDAGFQPAIQQLTPSDVAEPGAIVPKGWEAMSSAPD